MTRAEEAALKAYPIHSVLIQPARRGGYYADRHLRDGFIKGYEQAEKDTIERAVAWLKDYVKYFELYNEKGVEEFKKAMEEE